MKILRKKKLLNRSINIASSQDSLGFWIPRVDSGFQERDSGFFVRETWIPDTNRHQDSGFLKLYSRFQSLGFQNRNSFTWVEQPLCHVAANPELGFLTVPSFFRLSTVFISLVAYDYNTNGDKFRFQRSRNFAIYQK